MYLSQLIIEPTWVTDTSSSIIDHVYTSDPGKITECVVSQYAISDYYYPICFTRKINNKISKKTHKTSSYRCFKKFDDAHFISDLDADLQRFLANPHTVDEDFVALHSIIMKLQDKHALVKRRR